MAKSFLRSLVLVAFCSANSLLASTQDAVSIQEDSSILWTAGLFGADLVVSPEGEFERVSSTYYQPVGIMDRRGIAKARVIAEERAKAEIVRAISQMTASDRSIVEIQSEVSEASQSTSGDGTNLSSDTQRSIVETVVELTTSSSEGILRGVVVLEAGFDEKAQEVWVTVGISRKTLAAANSLQMLLSDEETGQLTEQESSNNEDSPGRVVRSRGDDW